MTKFCKICGGPINDSDYMCMTCGNYIENRSKKSSKNNKKDSKVNSKSTNRDKTTLGNFITDNPIAMDVIVGIFSLLCPALSILFIFFYGYKNKNWVFISLTAIMIRFVLAVFSAGLGAI